MTNQAKCTLAPPLLSAMKFAGAWRDYQARTLDEIDAHLQDRSLHVVAAPGSGKTVLGLELMRRFGRPALILAPSLTIRNQWRDRLFPQFLNDRSRWAGQISTNLEQPAAMTIATYQALHAVWSSDDDGQPAKAAPRLRRLIDTLHAHGPITLIVDEAHHLRREWWIALFALREALPEVTLVALTATPPYDAPLAEWSRYETMCGPVDTEISVPELVRNGDLCPHQDFVHLSRPRAGELALLNQRRDGIASLMSSLLADAGLLDWLAGHPWIVSPEAREEQILDRPEFLSAMLIVLANAGRPLPAPPLDLLGVARDEMPPFSPYWLETFLNGILDDPAADYAFEAEAARALTTLLHRQGLIENRRASLIESRQLFKAMASSLAKMDSIVAIARAESATLGARLRLVILSDHVRAADLPASPDDPFSPARLGVAGIFESLRRAGIADQPLGVLTGSLAIIPDAAKAALLEEARRFGIAVERLSLKALPACPGYSRLDGAGEADQSVVALLTALFQRGAIRILVGTQALLGEGWDAPAINSLVLASNAGSFMLSNQMRGRAIRIDPNDPGKVAAIWHLATVDPTAASLTERVDAGMIWGWNGAAYGANNADLLMLARRFESFEGIANGDSRIIENGLERLAVNPALGIETCNAATFAWAADRAAIAGRWRESLGDASSRAHVRKVAEPNHTPRRIATADTLHWLAVSGLAGGAFSAAGALRNLHYVGGFATLIMVFGGLTLLYALPKLARAAILFARNGTLERSLGQVGRLLIDALGEAGLLAKPAAAYEIVVRESLSGRYSVSLSHASRADERRFLEVLTELLGPIQNPRYILVRKSWLGSWRRTDYHAVPAALSANRAGAEAFQKLWTRRIGPSRLVFTRDHDGRRLLLRARARAFAAGFQRVCDRRSLWM